MEKKRSNAGFTLIEMMCALLVMVLLVMGMGVGMDAGSRIYRDATFEADSATLAGILNTSLGDILRYSINIREQSEFTPDERSEIGDDTVEFLFTSLDYGIQDAFFYTEKHDDTTSSGVLQMRSTRNGNTVDLINSGAYPDLVISNFVIVYSRREAPGIEGGYFDITYDIFSKSNTEKVRHVETIVRLMND